MGQKLTMVWQVQVKRGDKQIGVVGNKGWRRNGGKRIQIWNKIEKE